MKSTDWGGVKRARTKRKLIRRMKVWSIGILAFAFGGLTGPYIPLLRLETSYKVQQIKALLRPTKPSFAVQETKTPRVNPLQNEDGSVIKPVDNQFGLIIPKVGINATVLPNVNPADPVEYNKALQIGVAHAVTSFFPDQDGTVYLFSHSTNYDWFVKDLNAVFYLLKNLEIEDEIIVMYKDVPYSYKITDKRVVSPKDISYLVPQTGTKKLILQTCWPPGSTTERLLIFADYIP